MPQSFILMTRRQGFDFFFWIEFCRFLASKQSKLTQNVTIVSYDDEPDYDKEYEEVPPEVNAQMSNDFISAVNEVEEPEEPEEYEAIEEENIDLADLGSFKVF